MQIIADNWESPETDPIQQIWDALKDSPATEIEMSFGDLKALKRSPKAKIHVMWSSFGGILDGAGNPPSDAAINAFQVSTEQVVEAINRHLSTPITLKAAWASGVE